MVINLAIITTRSSLLQTMTMMIATMKTLQLSIRMGGCFTVYHCDAININEKTPQVNDVTLFTEMKIHLKYCITQ